MQWTFEERIDLQHPTGARNWPDLMMVQGDSRAHEWRVSVYDGGAAVDVNACLFIFLLVFTYGISSL